ncbi:hypothetical protein KKE60_05875 [Patescibacteria group bacterium]|nr:hypothetical protein [Patescibacteria group bacterium]
MKEKKGAIVLGIGALLGGLFLIFRKGKPALAEPPPNGVVVALWNPPSEAEVWQLVLTDWDVTVAIHQIGGLALLDVAEPITFEIPNGVQFPLRVVSLQVSKWNEARTALIVLYEMQSFRPYLWDFDAFDWSDIPDPSYREAFIPDYGSYYFNVAKERFEKA